MEEDEVGNVMVYFCKYRNDIKGDDWVDEDFFIVILIYKLVGYGYCNCKC